MALHRLTSVSIGVPNVAETAAYYEEFGLTRLDGPSCGGRRSARPRPPDRQEARFATVDGGEQLRLVHSPRRRLVELGIGAADPDDLGSVAARLAALGVAVEQTSEAVAAADPGTGVRVVLSVAGPVVQDAAPAIPQNAPGLRTVARCGPSPSRARARSGPASSATSCWAPPTLRPARGSSFNGVGFKISDTIAGAASFHRCSTDHHNLLVQAAPVPFLHHTSSRSTMWTRSAAAPPRCWTSTGSPRVGARQAPRRVEFLRAFKTGQATSASTTRISTASSTTSCGIPWVWDEIRALDSWGPPVPESFLAPDDLAALMAASHQP